MSTLNINIVQKVIKTQVEIRKVFPIEVCLKRGITDSASQTDVLRQIVQRPLVPSCKHCLLQF